TRVRSTSIDFIPPSGKSEPLPERLLKGVVVTVLLLHNPLQSTPAVEGPLHVGKQAPLDGPKQADPPDFLQHGDGFVQDLPGAALDAPPGPEPHFLPQMAGIVEDVLGRFDGQLP